MNSVALTRIEQSHKRLFRGIQNDLQVLEKNKSRELAAYEKSYKRIFRKPFSPSTREELVKASLNADIIFVGDFHPFNQSQKTFLRIVREVAEQDSRIVIALECAQKKFQKKIDHFLEGEITLEELREEIHYDEHWPFPWKNYSHIFQYAKSAKIPLVGLNISRRGGAPAPLAKRDKAGAQTLADIRRRWPEKRIFVLYGELHIARKHLPQETKKQTPARLLLLYQNEPSLYWKVAQQVNSQHLEVVKLAEDRYCIMNAVPWVKLQSYLDWIEGNLEGDDLEHHGIDLSSALLSRCEHIADALGIPMPKLLDFDLQNGEASPHLQSLLKKKQLVSEEAQALTHAIRYQRPIVLPTSRLVYVPVVSENSLSEAAALLLHFSMIQRKPEKILPKKNMSAVILRYCLGYLGSKILNPKRKCNEEKDIRNFLRKSAGQRSLLWAAKELDWAFGRRSSRWVPGPRWRNIHGFEAARAVGYILGDRLFTAVQTNPSLLQSAIDLFAKRTEGKAADAKLRALAESLPKRGLRLRGKREKL